MLGCVFPETDPRQILFQVVHLKVIPGNPSRKVGDEEREEIVKRDLSGHLVLWVTAGLRS